MAFKSSPSPSIHKQPIQVRGLRKRLPQAQKPALSLDQQKTDFTAEGSPPPGKVATAVPVTAAVEDGGGTDPAGIEAQVDTGQKQGTDKP